MNETPRAHGRDALDQQFEEIQDDIEKLSTLLREIGAAKAAEKRDAALAEATEVIKKSRLAIEGGRAKASQTTASVQEYIEKQPVQSALIALGVGFLFGMMTRR